MTLSTIIIEDEPLAQERLEQWVAKVPFLRLEASFDDAMKALTHLREYSVDLLLLDIHLDELSGIELLESANIDAQVIITTAYDQYALKGYELNVCDYLLKPFAFGRFLQAADKALKNHQQGQVSAPKQFLFVKTEHRLEKVMLDDILFIEGMRDYRRIHTSTKRIMTLTKFSELEEQLPVDRICRVHKSYMVALAKIDAVERSRIRIGDVVIPVSDSYRKSFFERITTAGN